MAGSVEPTKFYWEERQPDGTWARNDTGPAPDVRGNAREDNWHKVPLRGTHWRAHFRNPQGKSRSVTFDTKKEAETYLASVEIGKRKGQFVDPALGRILFDQWADDWFETRTTWAQSTRAGYYKAFEKHVLPFFGGRRLADIDRVLVKRFIAKLKDPKYSGKPNGYADKYVTANVGVVIGVFKLAIEAKAVVENPATGHGLSTRRRTEPMFLLPAQVDLLCAHIPYPYSLVALFLAYTGLRPSEACGLRICNTDLLGRRVHVVEALTVVAGKLVEKEPKTKKKRSVPLPRFLVDEVSRYIAWRRDKGDVLTPDGRLFPGAKSPNLRENWFHNEMLRPAAEYLGFKGLRSYDLRHIYASMLIAKGVHPKAIQERMGHENIAVTMDNYGHLFPSLEQQATDALDATYQALRGVTFEPAEPIAPVLSMSDHIHPPDPADLESPGPLALGEAAHLIRRVHHGRRETEKVCGQCGIRPFRAKDRCTTCLAYRERNGVERPRSLDDHLRADEVAS